MVDFHSPSEPTISSAVTVPPVPPEEPSFGARTWSLTKKTLALLGTKLLGPLVAIVVVIIGIVLVSMGFKNLQLGGILSKILGGILPKPSDTPIDIANSIEKGRVTPDGKLIDPGTPDSKGDTQVVVVPIQDPGIFSNPTTVTYVAPGDTKPSQVVLPDGVKNRDVSQVVVLKNDVIAVTVHDTSGIQAQHVDDLLKKYGG